MFFIVNYIRCFYSIPHKCVIVLKQNIHGTCLHPPRVSYYPHSFSIEVSQMPSFLSVPDCCVMCLSAIPALSVCQNSHCSTFHYWSDPEAFLTGFSLSVLVNGRLLKYNPHWMLLLLTHHTAVSLGDRRNNPNPFPIRNKISKSKIAKMYSFTLETAEWNWSACEEEICSNSWDRRQTQVCLWITDQNQNSKTPRGAGAY